MRHRPRRSPLRPPGTCIALAALALLAPARAPAQAPAPVAPARPMDLDAVRALVRLGDPQIAPDGRTVLVTVTRADHAANEFRTELVAVDVARGARTVLVPARPGVGLPRWSPRGDRVAFLAAGAEGEGRQLHVIPAKGGAPAQVTRAPAGVALFAWRPDGGALAYVAAEPRAKATLPQVGDPFEVGNDHYLTAAPPRSTHLWVVPAAGGAARRLTEGASSLSTALGGSPISWSPDGGAIAFVRLASASPGDTDQGTATVVDVASGAARPVLGRRERVGDALLSPDGSRLAYTYPRDGDPSNLDEAFVAPLTGGAGESVTRALDRQLSLVDWWPGGRALLLAGTDGTRRALWVQPVGSGAARRLPLGPVTAVGGASVARTGAVAFVGSEPTRPDELYVLPPNAAAPRRLTDLNAAVAARGLGRSERMTWPVAGGLTADGVVTYPPGFDSTRKYPLVLDIHGGPTASSTEGFAPRVQLLAARGWVVFQPNYRGSDNLGNAFQRAIANDAGEGPGRDVVAGVDRLVARGFVDPARVAVGGWSYGGFMTAWLIGRYPGRWRAAVAGAAPVDLTDMYALTDLNVMRRHAITGSPFVGDNLAKYMAMSPLAHLSKARTPTLVMSMAADVRVSVTGSYKLYHALKDNGVPVQFVAFPGGGHGPADPARQLERDRRWVAWLARWLDPAT